MDKFASGVSMVASLSLKISYPTMTAAPHMFLNAYKNVIVFTYVSIISIIFYFIIL